MMGQVLPVFLNDDNMAADVFASKITTWLVEETLPGERFADSFPRLYLLWPSHKVYSSRHSLPYMSSRQVTALMFEFIHVSIACTTACNECIILSWPFTFRYSCLCRVHARFRDWRKLLDGVGISFWCARSERCGC
eukprot:COSAG05_NODE_513_length_9084_cov_5.373957_4_plen_136_part_00